MGLFSKVRRGGMLGAGLASLAGAVSTPEVGAAIKPKVSGETKVVAVFGITDNYNGIGCEVYVRQIFESKKDFRLIFVRANKMFTPQLISDADLLMICRDNSPDPIDLSGEDGLLADTIVKGTTFYTDANVKAIVDNVRNRGMGLLAMHNSIMCNNIQFMNFIDVVGIGPHNFEPIWYTRMNKTHPVTQGIGKFPAIIDQQLSVIIKSTTTATLFESTAVHEKRQAISGWALDSRKGRIVGLLPGSTIHVYQTPEYQNIVWRAAHWAMRSDIPKYPKAENTHYL
jgi:type 1 glutamine amidotransferase